MCDFHRFLPEDSSDEEVPDQRPTKRPHKEAVTVAEPPPTPKTFADASTDTDDLLRFETPEQLFRYPMAHDNCDSADMMHADWADLLCGWKKWLTEHWWLAPESRLKKKMLEEYRHELYTRRHSRHRLAVNYPLLQLLLRHEPLPGQLHSPEGFSVALSRVLSRAQHVDTLHQLLDQLQVSKLPCIYN